MNPTATLCPSCSAALADDQRYCLACGSRQGEARVEYLEVLAPPSPASAPTNGNAPLPPARSDAISPGLAAAAVGLAVLFLGVGVLIGRAGSDDAPQVASEPTVVTVEGGAPASESAAAETTTNASVTTFKSDWPAGEEGWTVQLQTLPKKGTAAADVQAAEKAATDKGAKDVGALDSDDFEALDAAQYVIYSGRFDSKAKAQDALGDLRKDFPDASVVQVTDAAPVVNSAKSKADKAAVEALDSASGDDYSKQSQKLPDELELPGKPPPKDGKEGGGGTGFEAIE